MEYNKTFVFLCIFFSIMFMFVLGNRLTVGEGFFFSCIMSCVGSPHFTASVGTVNKIIRERERERWPCGKSKPEM